MGSRRAFTLIELLVVIAIVALLLAILLPVLADVKKHGKAVACQSNLSQWGRVFSMYTMDNDGYFADAAAGQMWTATLKPYYQEAALLRCPGATRPAAPDGSSYPLGSTFLAWGVFDSTFAMLGLEGLYGSYGMNGYAAKPTPGIQANPWGYDTRNNWPSPNVTGAAYIPLLLDCAWLGGFPSHEDNPPQHDGQTQGSGPQGSNDEIRRYCMDRHRRGINGLLLDSAVRKITLKELWKLKWHQEFDTGGPWTLAGGVHPHDWPEWMRDMPDY